MAVKVKSFWDGSTGNTSKQQKMAAFSDNFLSGDGFESVLAIFCSYDYGPNATTYQWQ